MCHGGTETQSPTSKVLLLLFLGFIYHNTAPDSTPSWLDKQSAIRSPRRVVLGFYFVQRRKKREIKSLGNEGVSLLRKKESFLSVYPGRIRVQWRWNRLETKWLIESHVNLMYWTLSASSTFRWRLMDEQLFPMDKRWMTDSVLLLHKKSFNSCWDYIT